MHVFLTGANGWIGSAITRELLAAGHTVTGLVRSRGKAETVAAAGATPLLGSLQDLNILRTAAESAGGVIHTAFGIDFSRIAELAAEDRKAIETFADVFAGSNRPLLATGGFGLLPPGQKFTEDARPAAIPGFPRASEQTIFAVAQRGVRASVVRLPRSVHGLGERHGFIPMLAAHARATGLSAFVADGQNLWPSVHRQDAARLYCLALARNAQGQAFHAVADEGVPYRLIAEAIARQLNIPAKSLTPGEAERHFGPFATWVAGNGPASSEKTRSDLKWTPREPGLIADIDQPAYYA
jgi:nucleoside-diphosphate-sugar epimerase